MQGSGKTTDGILCGNCLRHVCVAAATQPRMRTAEDARDRSQNVRLKFAIGALGGTRTPTILLTATSRQRVYQFRHERLECRRAPWGRRRINGAGCNKSEGG